MLFFLLPLLFFLVMGKRRRQELEGDVEFRAVCDGLGGGFACLLWVTGGLGA